MKFGGFTTCKHLLANTLVEYKSLRIKPTTLDEVRGNWECVDDNYLVKLYISKYEVNQSNALFNYQKKC